MFYSHRKCRGQQSSRGTRGKTFLPQLLIQTTNIYLTILTFGPTLLHTPYTRYVNRVKQPFSIWQEKWKEFHGVESLRRPKFLSRAINFSSFTKAAVSLQFSQDHSSWLGHTGPIPDLTFLSRSVLIFSYHTRLDFPSGLFLVLRPKLHKYLTSLTLLLERLYVPLLPFPWFD